MIVESRDRLEKLEHQDPRVLQVPMDSEGLKDLLVPKDHRVPQDRLVAMELLVQLGLPEILAPSDPKEGKGRMEILDPLDLLSVKHSGGWSGVWGSGFSAF